MRYSRRHCGASLQPFLVARYVISCLSTSPPTEQTKAILNTMSTPPRRRRHEDATSALIRVIAAIDIAKAAVPTQLGQGILSAASAILLIIRVGPF
jgi:hypothetical protein